MRYDNQSIERLISQLKQAKTEQDVQAACQEIKLAVVNRWVNENSRRKPMAEIRKAVREAFPAKGGKSPHEVAPFPYYFTDSGKGKIARWEHLAIRHLREDWNVKSVDEIVEPTEATEIVKADLTTDKLLDSLGLTADELESVKQAVGDANIKEWVKQAIMQRAKTVNKLRASLDADWASIPTETLREKRYRTNSAACRELASRAVRVIKQWNYDHPEHKWCITNKLISELTGITAKAIAKAVEGMDNESYNHGQDLSPVVNRLVRAAVGEPSEVMNIKDVDGTEAR